MFYFHTTGRFDSCYVAVVTKTAAVLVAPLNRRLIAGVEPRTLGEDDQPRLPGG